MCMYNSSSFFNILYDANYPNESLPKIECSSDGVAYFSITLDLTIFNLYSTTCSVYRLSPPSSSEDRWMRQSDNLWTQDICNFNVVELYDNYFQINAEFLPSTIPGIDDSQYYSVEFFVNASTSASVKGASPKLIVKISNDLI